MKCVSVLVPLLMVDSDKNIVDVLQLSNNMYQRRQDCLSAILQYFLFKSRMARKKKQQEITQSKYTNVTFQQMEDVIAESKRNLDRYQRLKQLFDYKIPEKQSREESRVNSNSQVEMEGLIKKVRKYKEENKKLRKLLQMQLENTEKVRGQTQKTMEHLKQQFEGILKQVQKSNQHDSRNFLNRN